MEIGKDYINSFFNPYDVESIYSAIVHYEGTSLKKKRPIPSYLYEKFSWSNVVEHYLEEYKSLLN
jgi:hypothetical protein